MERRQRKKNIENIREYMQNRAEANMDLAEQIKLFFFLHKAKKTKNNWQYQPSILVVRGRNGAMSELRCWILLESWRVSAYCAPHHYLGLSAARLWMGEALFRFR